MIEINQFAVQHSLITPVALALGEPPPTKIANQKWMVLLSGVALIDLKGTLVNDWLRDSVRIQIDIRPTLQRMILRHSIPEPPGNAHTPGLQVDDSVPFAGLSSVLDPLPSGRGGYAVDAWKPALISTEINAFTGASIPRFFLGIQANLAALNKDTVIHRVSYHMTLVGKIVFAKTQVIP